LWSGTRENSVPSARSVLACSLVVRRVLIVDDSRTTIEVVRVHLMGNSYVFDTAANGTDALASMARHAPDLIVSDLMMPDISGLDLCRRVRADPALSDRPFVLVTSHKDEATRRAAFAAGVDGFLTKPIDSRRLSALVSRLLSH